MNFADETGPIPSQLVNESRTDPIAGSQISPTTSSVGMATKRVTTTRSRADSWSIPLYLAMPRLLFGRKSSLASGREDALLLLLDLVDEAVDVLGVLDELLEGREHHGRREVRAGVPVEELGDRLRGLHEFDRLLLERRVAGLV